MKYHLYKYDNRLIIRITEKNQIVRVVWVAEASRADVVADFSQNLNDQGIEIDISDWELQYVPTSGQADEVRDAKVMSVYVYKKYQNRYQQEIKSLKGFSKDAFEVLAYIIGSDEVALGYVGTFEDIHKKYTDT